MFKIKSKEKGSEISEREPELFEEEQSSGGHEKKKERKKKKMVAKTK